jgi:hypothetical protein
MEDSG